MTDLREQNPTKKLDNSLSNLYEITYDGERFLSPDIRKQILALFNQWLEEQGAWRLVDISIEKGNPKYRLEPLRLEVTK